MKEDIVIDAGEDEDEPITDDQARKFHDAFEIVDNQMGRPFGSRWVVNIPPGSTIQPYYIGVYTDNQDIEELDNHKQFFRLPGFGYMCKAWLKERAIKVAQEARGIMDKYKEIQSYAVVHTNYHCPSCLKITNLNFGKPGICTACGGKLEPVEVIDVPD